MKEWAELGGFKSYLVGFFLSILLTLSAYFAVVNHHFPKTLLLLVIVGSGTLQMLVQFIFFLHLGKESKPRWNMMVFLFMALVAIILVIGSLWIMYHLDYQLMDMHSMHTHEGI